MQIEFRPMICIKCCVGGAIYLRRLRRRRRSRRSRLVPSRGQVPDAPSLQQEEEVGGGRVKGEELRDKFAY